MENTAFLETAVSNNPNTNQFISHNLELINHCTLQIDSIVKDHYEDVCSNLGSFIGYNSEETFDLIQEDLLESLPILFGEFGSVLSDTDLLESDKLAIVDLMVISEFQVSHNISQSIDKSIQTTSNWIRHNSDLSTAANISPQHIPTPLIGAGNISIHDTAKIANTLTDAIASNDAQLAKASAEAMQHNIDNLVRLLHESAINTAASTSIILNNIIIWNRRSWTAVIDGVQSVMTAADPSHDHIVLFFQIVGVVIAVTIGVFWLAIATASKEVSNHNYRKAARSAKDAASIFKYAVKLRRKFFK